MTVFEKSTGDLTEYDMVQCKHCYHHRRVGDLAGKRCTKETYFPLLSGERWRRCHLFTENRATAHPKQRTQGG